MFSYFEKGIRDNKPSYKLPIEWLESIIKCNPNAGKIKLLHGLEYGCEEYKSIKETLPYITPHGTFQNTRINENLEQFSGYLYFDIDAAEIGANLEAYKQKVISIYKDFIYMLGSSVGGRGIFFYIKLANPEILTKENFADVYNYVKNKVLSAINTDNNAKGLVRPQFIPMDSNLYVNKEAKLKISKEVTSNLYFNQKNNINKKQEGIIQCIKEIKEKGYTLNDTFLPINEILGKIRLQTHVDVVNECYDVKPVDFVKCFIPKTIKDGYKHSTYRSITNVLMYLNPGIELITIQSFIYWINVNFTGGKPMKQKELLNTVEHSYNKTIENGELLAEIKTKNIHFNKNCGLSGEEKRDIAAKVNGKIRKDNSLNIIKCAIDVLKALGKKATQKNISELIKERTKKLEVRPLSIITLKRHWQTVQAEVLSSEIPAQISELDVCIKKDTNPLKCQIKESVDEISKPLEYFIYYYGDGDGRLMYEYQFKEAKVESNV